MSSVFHKENKNYIYLLFSVLVVKAIFLCFIAASSYLSLAPDEAQYWTWSDHLDWGYYSKPPGIAWQIWFTTSILGNTPLGVRFGAILIGFILPWVIFGISSRAGFSTQISFWSAIVMAFSPLGVYLSIAATTDAGMILFLTLAIMAVVKGFRDEENPNYLLSGFYIFLGALFKWTAYVFWPFLIVFLFFHRSIKRKNLIIAIAVSLLAFIPIFYWNTSHDWATFRHVFNTVYQPSQEVKKSGNILDFLGAQIGLLTPVFLILLVWSYFYLNRVKSRALLFCAMFPFAVLVFFVMAFFKKMQPNWAVYLYPPGMVLISYASFKYIRGGRIWLYIGTGLSIVGVLASLSIPLIQKKGVASQFPISYKANPFRQNMGWSRVPSILMDVGYRPLKDFLFADKYQAASILSFYSPDEKLAYFFNLNHQRKNQFSYWPSMAEKEKGKNGYFVVFENTKESSLKWYEQHYVAKLSPYFEKVEYLGGFPLFEAYGKAVKYAIVFKGIHYSGEIPKDPEQY